MTRALIYMDDSSGIVGNDLSEMMGLYARACQTAPPKPGALAKWLVTLLFDGPGWPRIMLREFAGALGERGLAEVARLVEDRARGADPQSWTAAFAVRDLREQLAELSDDVDRYVTVLVEHLNSVVQYERITRALLDAGRRAEAIVWAQRGLADKPGWPHSERLRDTLVELLLADGRPDADVQVRRTEFERHPSAATYRSLAATNMAVGIDNPEPWALQTLRERVARQPGYASELVAVLLSLGHHEEAWEVGRSHRAQLGDQRWLELLEHHRVRNPAEVIAPYQDMIERHILDSSDKQRYRRAVALVGTLSDAYTSVGDPIAFPAYLTDLRVRHARRPTFIKTLDAADLCRIP